MTAELVATLTWTTDRRLTEASGACQAVLGRPGAALVGLALPEALGIPAARAAQLDARARGAEGRAVEFLSVERPGVEGHVTLRLALARAGDRVQAAVVDLSALLEGAPPVQISALSSSLSHEIRNPLSSVKMAVQTLARNTGLSERDQRRLTIANREIRTMERMLWLLSEYGRDTPPHFELLPVRSVVQEALQLVQLELSERRVTLDVSEAADLPRARVDIARVRPVLAQLLLNVAMGQGEDSRVAVSLLPGPDASTVLLKVRDPAAALPEADRATLFEPFGSRLARGAGLSLAALRRVMLGQGGDVLVEGGEQPGLVFTLVLPAAS